MRYITVPAPVVIEGAVNAKDPKTPVTHSFSEFVCKTLVAHPEVTSTDELLGLFMRVVDKVKAAPVGAVVSLTDDEHEALSKFARTLNYAPDTKLSVLPLVKAITGAAHKEPENGKPLLEKVEAQA